MSQFQRYIGIDYSGAATPTTSLKGLRVYSATPTQPPREVSPPPGRSKYWTRRGIAEWLATELHEGPPALVGIDHAFSFPLRYFEAHRIPHSWPAFLEDFHHHWPTDGDEMTVELIRRGLHGRAPSRLGDSRWRRLTELRCRAKSVFHFDVQGSVAKSTHAGLPWLLHLRRQLGQRVHFWPFDGWTPPPDRSVVAEIYPSLSSRNFAVEDRTPDQHDAYSVARWMRETDALEELGAYFHPKLSTAERDQAETEGWILGMH
jgi:hypothetical protein